jgi:hypothetical protein
MRRRPPDVCKFEHFIDTVSRYPEITGRKLDVIGVYVAWRGLADIGFRQIPLW